MEPYRKEMGPPPVDIDQLSAVPPAQRRAAEKKAAEQSKKDYPMSKTTSKTSTPSAKEAADEITRESRRSTPPNVKMPTDIKPASSPGRGAYTLEDMLNMSGVKSKDMYASGGKVRGGGCEQRGKTRGRMV